MTTHHVSEPDRALLGLISTRLCRRIVGRCAERDPAGEIRQWLSAIAEMVAGAE
jgi:hypothetical protein